MFWYICTGFVASFILYVIKVLVTKGDSDYEANDFDAFIVDAVSVNKNKKEDVRQKYYRNYKEPGHQILILYGTEYGFSEEIARKLLDRIESSMTDSENWQPRLVNMKDYQYLDFSAEQIVLLIVSTAGDGVPPTDAREFFLHMTNSTPSLSHIHFAVLALGDSNYPHYCKAGKTIDERFSALSRKQLVGRMDIDQEDWASINSWMSAVIASLGTVSPVSKLDYLQLPEPSNEDDTAVSRTRPFIATLKVKYDLTSTESQEDKETIHCEFDLTGSDITWTSGDALGIYPRNCSGDVNRLLMLLGCCGSEKVDTPHWAYSPSPDGPITLIECLSHYYDLKTVRLELLELIKSHAVKASEVAELASLLNGKLVKENQKLQKLLGSHEVADILQAFPDTASQLQVEHVLQVMRQLQPRYYSISSSPLKDENTACVTAAIVRYKLLGLPRTGVCTTYLQDRMCVGDTCPVFISHNPDFRLPADPHLPIIMIGPGTGIAPFRAFIQEREDKEKCGLNLLYFGCRHKKGDFLYKEELEKLASQNVIHLRVAFSRDQARKIYVQDLIKEDAARIWNLIQNEGAHVYVCGDAKHMAHDVHQALCDVIAQHGSCSEQQAIHYLHDLEKQQRYQKDVWVT